METIAVIGGGLVGSMVSCFLARNGYQVDVYEMRDDPRTQAHVPGKSINMALSERGRSALRSLGLEDYILENYAIKMKARLIHDLNGIKREIPYGRKDQFILSVGRRFLNELLLTEAQKYKNISLHFNYKLVAANLDEGKMSFMVNDDKHKPQRQHKADLIIGCDGAFSSVRRAMVKLIRFDYSQQYIEHGYIELSIPPKDDGQYAMEVNYLHIWPRGGFMMIALPNLDHSFTVTLFMPFAYYESITTEEDLLKFFEKYFPDSIPLIGEDDLIKSFFRAQPLPLISIKCNPYNYSDKVLLMGDAAHAMVPFYGQGMNCGFEDCLILNELLEEHSNSIRKVIPLFSDERIENCHTIIDLAMYNYIEMRDLVNSKAFLIRKKFDSFLNILFPRHWIPLYSMVTFTRIPYKDCLKYRQWQNLMINRSGKVCFFAFVTAFFYNFYRTGRITLFDNKFSIEF